jgi:hypothetical protein
MGMLTTIVVIILAFIFSTISVFISDVWFDYMYDHDIYGRVYTAAMTLVTLALISAGIILKIVILLDV